MPNDAMGQEPVIGVSVRRAFFYVGVFYFLMLLFNGVAMSESAQQLTYGRTHDFWVAVLRPVAAVSKGSGLSWVRTRTQETVGGWLNQSAKSRKEK